MSWWSLANTEPKRKNRFYVSILAGGTLYAVSSISKPAVTIESKEYKLVNHYYKYPGIPKWEPISIKFVDSGMWGSGKAMVGGNPIEATTRSTSKTLWEMLLSSGYVSPRGTKMSSKGLVNVVAPEKAAMVDLSFGSSIVKTDGAVFEIHQVNGAGKTTEKWTLYNPMITKISWGDLDYASDDLVEYTLDVAYDWAELT
jgi:hypothetical protein